MFYRVDEYGDGLREDGGYNFSVGDDDFSEVGKKMRVIQ
jgi:hypothetical protein